MMSPMTDVPMVSAAVWSRACRRARSLSQRELAATGFALVAVDGGGRVLRSRDVVNGPYDRSGRCLPVHLRPGRTLPMMAPSTWDQWRWWGWGSVAWSDHDRTVPAWTYHHWRRTLPRFGDRGDDIDPRREIGRVWDDAT